MKGINIFNADDFDKKDKAKTQAFIDKAWHLARPIGDYSPMHRFKCAWEVFTGKADVLRFYKQ